MKKNMIFVALIALLVVATQAQTSIKIVTYPIPTKFELKVGQTESGLCIILAGSQVGVNYQLAVLDNKGKGKEVKDIGNQIQGTGNPLIFHLPADNRNVISCMVNALSPCGEFEMKNVITADDIKKITEKIRASESYNGVIETDYFDPGILSREKKSEKSVAGAEFNPRTLSRLHTPELVGSDVLNFGGIGLFIVVILIYFYGIKNRKKIILGKHQEIKPKFTGTVYSSRFRKK